MRTRTIPIVSALMIGLFLAVSGCLPRPDPANEVALAVAGTLTAWPTSSPTLTPSPALAELSGLFCEYRFCLGHPTDLAFFDVNAQRNPSAPSSYNQGILAAFSSNAFIELIWSLTTTTADPQAMLDLILESGVDSREGSLDVRLIGDLDVYLTSISTSASPLLPHGSAAAWTCGERAFAWKAYAASQPRSESLFQEAIGRFRCE